LWDARSGTVFRKEAHSTWKKKSCRLYVTTWGTEYLYSRLRPHLVCRC
jgi:hypothetical protein